MTRNERIVERLLVGETYQAVATDYGVSRQRIGQIARAHQLPARPRRDPSAGRRDPHLDPRWLGRCLSMGYVMVGAPQHPRANKRGYVFEQIIVAEAALGRALLPKEIVHHINGDRSDNRPENLQVMTRAEHSRLHNLVFTAALLTDWLRWLALRVGHTPAAAEIEKHLPVWRITYRERFGSLTNAARAAGLSPNGHSGRGHGGVSLPLHFRAQHVALLRFPTPEALADALHGGLKSEHQRRNEAA